MPLLEAPSPSSCPATVLVAITTTTLSQQATTTERCYPSTLPWWPLFRFIALILYLYCWNFLLLRLFLLMLMTTNVYHPMELKEELEPMVFIKLFIKDSSLCISSIRVYGNVFEVRHAIMKRSLNDISYAISVTLLQFFCNSYSFL